MCRRRNKHVRLAYNHCTPRYSRIDGNNAQLHRRNFHGYTPLDCAWNVLNLPRLYDCADRPVRKHIENSREHCVRSATSTQQSTCRVWSDLLCSFKLVLCLLRWWQGGKTKASSVQWLNTHVAPSHGVITHGWRFVLFCFFCCVSVQTTDNQCRVTLAWEVLFFFLVPDSANQCQLLDDDKNVEKCKLKTALITLQIIQQRRKSSLDWFCRKRKKCWHDIEIGKYLKTILNRD